jgi:hypothetical protein
MLCARRARTGLDAPSYLFFDVLGEPDVTLSLFEPDSLDEADSSGIAAFHVHDHDSRPFLFESLFQLVNVPRSLSEGQV